MLEWRRVPWPLWIYSAVVLLGAVLVEVKADGPIPADVLFAAIILASLYFLLKGVRWVWIVTVGLYGLGLVSDVISGSLEWRGVGLSLIGFMLLLLPVTWRYFSSQARIAPASLN